jgi:hypothetical protein
MLRIGMAEQIVNTFHSQSTVAKVKIVVALYLYHAPDALLTMIIMMLPNTEAL